MLRNSRFCTFPKEKKRSLTASTPKIGPGEYNPLYNIIKTKNSICKFSKEKRDKIKKNTNPGPGQYYNKSDFKKKIILGKFSKSKKFLKKADNLPGPGKYKKNSEFNDNIIKKKGFTICSKKEILQNSQNPCCTKYNKISFVENNIRKKRGFEISKQKKLFSKKKNNLGPGSYKEKRFIGEDVKGGRFNLDKKLKEKKKNFIGPGAYNVKIDKNSPEWKFSKNFFKNEKENFPGPEKYYPNDFYIKKNFPKFSFSKNRRDLEKTKKDENSEIGPCSYFKEKIDIKKKGIIFSKNKKFFSTEKKNEIPGPGKYKIKSYINSSTNSGNFLKSKNFSCTKKKKKIQSVLDFITII